MEAGWSTGPLRPADSQRPSSTHVLPRPVATLSPSVRPLPGPLHECSVPRLGGPHLPPRPTSPLTPAARPPCQPRSVSPCPRFLLAVGAGDFWVGAGHCEVTLLGAGYVCDPIVVHEHGSGSPSLGRKLGFGGAVKLLVNKWASCGAASMWGPSRARCGLPVPQDARPCPFSDARCILGVPGCPSDGHGQGPCPV